MSPSRRRLALAVLAALVATTGILAVLRPGRTDLPDRTLAGTEAPDDGYWTSPLRRIAGAGRQDAFDDGLALSLALPENALGALAWRLGVPAEGARFAGSAAALFASILAASLLGGPVPVAMLLALLFAAPMLGHVRSDLGEGTAFGLVSLFGLAIVRGRIGLAAGLAGIGLFQKACGWPLGVGVLAAVLVGPGRAGRFRAAAIGTVCGVAACAGIAALAFGDDPLRFLVRPFVATAKAGTGIDVKSVLMHAAFPGAYGVGPRLLAVAGLGWCLTRRRTPPVALVAAMLAGSAFAALFPDPWRVLPFWWLVPGLLAVPVPDAEPPLRLGPSRLPSTYLLAQLCVATVVLLRGDATTGPRLVAGAGAAAIVLDAVLARRGRGTDRLLERRLEAALVAALSLFAVWGGVIAVRACRDGGTERLAFAARLSDRLPRDAHLIAYSFVATSFQGTLYYPPFQAHWEDELARSDAPTILYRVRSVEARPNPPPGYVTDAVEPLGSLAYGVGTERRTLVLETLRRP